MSTAQLAQSEQPPYITVRTDEQGGTCWAVGAKKESMGPAQLPQSEKPYITVQTDEHGGTCWAVVGLGTVVHCYTGHHAITVLQAMCTATGVVTPS